MKATAIAWLLSIYPVLHNLLPVVVKRMRPPAPDEKGGYAVLYDILDYFAAGRRERPIAEVEVVKTQTTNVTVTPTESK